MGSFFALDKGRATSLSLSLSLSLFLSTRAHSLMLSRLPGYIGSGPDPSSTRRSLCSSLTSADPIISIAPPLSLSRLSVSLCLSVCMPPPLFLPRSLCLSARASRRLLPLCSTFLPLCSTFSLAALAGERIAGGELGRLQRVIRRAPSVRRILMRMALPASP